MLVKPVVAPAEAEETLTGVELTQSPNSATPPLSIGLVFTETRRRPGDSDDQPPTIRVIGRQHEPHTTPVAPRAEHAARGVPGPRTTPDFRFPPHRPPSYCSIVGPYEERQRRIHRADSGVNESRTSRIQRGQETHRTAPVVRDLAERDPATRDAPPPGGRDRA